MRELQLHARRHSFPRDGEHLLRRVDAPDRSLRRQRGDEPSRAAAGIENALPTQIRLAHHELEELPPVVVLRAKDIVSRRARVEIRLT